MKCGDIILKNKAIFTKTLNQSCILAIFCQKNDCFTSFHMKISIPNPRMEHKVQQDKLASNNPRFHIFNVVFYENLLVKATFAKGGTNKDKNYRLQQTHLGWKSPQIIVPLRIVTKHSPSLFGGKLTQFDLHVSTN